MEVAGAVLSAREQGFALPVVYNSNGYDSLEAPALLEGVVDIYLPDVKYVSPRLTGDASSTHDYPGHNSAAISEMFRQVGPLTAGEDAIANKGVLLQEI